MRRLLVLLIFVPFIIESCQKVPITGRRQLKLLPESQLVGMSLTSYSQFLNENKSKVMTSGPEVTQVNRVGKDIQYAVIKMLGPTKFNKVLKDFRWEYNVVDDPQANAWCMPGGKVVVYTGILKHTKDDDGLAVVMGHEIAHAIGRHGNERMSQGLLAQAGLIGLDVALAQKTSDEKRALLMQAAGIGTQVGVMLPFSRAHESEADEMGLIFAAAAGYDPRAAVGFWQRMAAGGGAGVPEFLSTHPGHKTRISNIQTKYLPKAMKYYNEAKK